MSEEGEVEVVEASDLKLGREAKNASHPGLKLLSPQLFLGLFFRLDVAKSLSLDISFNQISYLPRVPEILIIQ
jgi:hypothetical protein